MATSSETPCPHCGAVLFDGFCPECCRESSQHLTSDPEEMNARDKIRYLRVELARSTRGWEKQVERMKQEHATRMTELTKTSPVSYILTGATLFCILGLLWGGWTTTQAYHVADRQRKEVMQELGILQLKYEWLRKHGEELHEVPEAPK